MPINQASKNRIDPDPIVIATLLMTTLGVILQLESKIEVRREIARTRRVAQSRATVFAALDEIQQSISVFEAFWTFFEGLGRTEAGQGEVGFGHAQKFVTEDEYSSFLDRLDQVLDDIGSLNRAVQKILFTQLDEIEPDTDEHRAIAHAVLKVKGVNVAKLGKTVRLPRSRR